MIAAAAVKEVTDTIPGMDTLGLRPSNTLHEVLLILGVSLAVGLLCLAAFLIFRKKPGQLVNHRHSSGGRSSSGSLFRGGSSGRKKRHRQPREQFTHRNPTRAEMGGFPNLRDEPQTPAPSTPRNPE